MLQLELGTGLNGLHCYPKQPFILLKLMDETKEEMSGSYFTLTSALKREKSPCFS